MAQNSFKIEASKCPDDLFINKKFNVLLNLDDFICLEEQKQGNKEWCEVICKGGKSYCVSIEEAERIAKELCDKM